MDIHPIDAAPTPDERAAVDVVLGAAKSSWDGGSRGSVRDSHTAHFGGRESRESRHMLLPVLEALQARVGWLSEGGLGYACTRLNVPPADAWAVATFYSLLATSPRPKRVVHVCDDIGCKCRGADKLIEDLEQTVGPAHTHAPDATHATVADDGAVWMRSPCLGMCDQAPAAFVTVAGARPSEHKLGDVTAEQVRMILSGDAHATGKGLAAAHIDSVGAPRLLRRVGKVDPTSIDAYRATRGFAALAKAFEVGAKEVIAEVAASKLLGRGGAAFPTGRKWEAVAQQAARPHYLICNGDESEPGTFSNRVLMEADPFEIIEGMTIGAFATGCEQGYIYVRGEYPLAARRLQHAIDESRAHGFLGENILQKGMKFDIEIRRGAGAYICGEETAIFESIEGRRGEPRNKPPFPTEVGLFGKPTLVNNVETFAHIPLIVLEGGDAYATIGTTHSTGTRVFCLSGCVQRPGVYESPNGPTVRQLIDLAGGVAPGRTIQAVLLGGAAGTFLRPGELDLQLSHEHARAVGATLGSGVIMVFDDSIDMRGIVSRIAAFFRDESCGQCVPCRVGTVRQEEALNRLAKQRTLGGVPRELALLDEIGVAMRDASICGLGQTAYAAVESAVKRLRLYDGEGADR